MSRFFIALAALATTAGSLAAVHAVAAAPSKAPVVTIRGVERPILLKRMVVTATPLPDTPEA